MQSRPTRRRRFLTMFAGTSLIAGSVMLLTGSVAAQASPRAARAATFRVTDEYHQTISVTGAGTKLADSQSSNWSGYNQGVLDTDTLTSSITGTWVVPTATPHTAGEAEDSAT